MSQYITILDKNIDEQASQPSYINLNLKPHQLMMIKKCIDIETNGIQIKNEKYIMETLIDMTKVTDTNIRNKICNEPIHLQTKFGAICDIVGSGKTYVALSLIRYDLNNKINFQQGNSMMSYSVKNDYTMEQFNHPLSNKISLIVVPHVIIAQWKSAINLNTNLTMIEYSSKKSCDLTDVDLILVSNTQYKNLLNKFPNLCYKRVFFDEADSIAITTCPKPPASFFWFMTSSYKKLLMRNGVFKQGFIRKTFNETLVNIKKYLLIKNDDEFVQQSFNIPDFKNITIECKTNRVLSILKNLVSDNVQRMICAGNIAGAIQTFNLDSSDDENIIQVVCKDLMIKLNNKKAKLDFVKAKTYHNSEQKAQAIASLNKKISEIEDSIASIKTKIEESDMDPITYCEIENPVVTKCCKTVFDFESITIYLATRSYPNCPICRTPIEKKNLILKRNVVTKKLEEKEDNKYHFENYTKNENLKYLFNNVFTEANKIILFSEYDASLEILQKLNIVYKEVKGHSTTINKTIQWFNESSNDRKVLFMNSQYCGAGLNLQTCTDIIIYHDMNSSLTTQIIGRAQRYGRTQPLRVYSFEE